MVGFGFRGYKVPFEQQVKPELTRWIFSTANGAGALFTLSSRVVFANGAGWGFILNFLCQLRTDFSDRFDVDVNNGLRLEDNRVR